MELYLEIRTQENLSDCRLISELHSLMFDNYQRDQILNSVEGGLFNAFVDSLIDFIFDYDSGALKPDKWDYCEPIRQLVTSKTRQILKQELSFPNSEVILKRIKNKKNLIMVSNTFHGPTKIHPFLYGDFESSYLGFISMYTNSSSHSDIEVTIRILGKICQLLRTDYGIIKRLDTGEIVYNASTVHYSDVYSRPEKDSLSIRLIVEWINRLKNSQADAFRSRAMSFSYDDSFTMKEEIDSSLYLFSVLRFVLEKDKCSLYAGIVFLLFPAFDIKQNSLFRDADLVQSVDFIISKKPFFSLPEIQNEYSFIQLKPDEELLGKEMYYFESLKKDREHFILMVD